MGQPRRTQPRIPPFPRLPRGDDRVGPFHAQNDAERRALRSLLNRTPVRCKVRLRADEPQMSLFFEQLVVGKLCESGAIGDGRIGVIEVTALVGGFEWLFGT